MELVYLWVDNYKNINKQGFNFSPRFSCKYNEDKNELIIDKNNDYIENFFDEDGNIDVTAIVGKNGSGKSSLLKLIFMLIYCKKYSYELAPPLHDNIIELIRPFFNIELFLVIFHENEFKKISMKYFIKQLHEKYGNDGLLLDLSVTILNCDLKVSYEGTTSSTELEKESLNFFSVHFNYMVDTLFDGEQDKWIKEIYHKADSYDTPLLLEPYKNNDKRQVIDLDIIEYLNNQNLLRFYHELLSNTKITNFFNPNKISINTAYSDFDWSNLSDEDFECLQDCSFFIAHKFFQLYDSNDTFLDLREDSKIKICKICTKIKSLYKNKDYEALSYLYIALKVLTSNKRLFNKDEYEKISNWASTLESEKNLLEFINKLNLSNLIDDDAPAYEVMKIQVTIDFLENETYRNGKFVDNIDSIVSLKEMQNILEFIPPWINVEWYEDNKSIKSLSSGEKSFFTFLINLMYQVQNINNEPKYNTINLFLDETELGFHPQWHKEYLNNILEALKKINKKKINIIFATHSPFLISDLPKENVMFLKDGKQDAGIKHKQTFGANIHTLLSDSFFMKDSLMGEFAKGKINEIIEFHKEVEEAEKDKSDKIALKTEYDINKKRFWDIQSIIGEDYLKQVVKNHLVVIESILLDQDEAKKEEIQRLRAEADRLEAMQ